MLSFHELVWLQRFGGDVTSAEMILDEHGIQPDDPAFLLGWVPLDLIDWADPDGMAVDTLEAEPARVRSIGQAFHAADHDPAGPPAPPPVVMIAVADGTYACADGSRRLAALRALGRDHVLAWVAEPLADGGFADTARHPVPDRQPPGVS